MCLMESLLMPINAQPAPSRKLRIGLVQINNSFSGQNYLPLSVGMLQAYAEKHLPNPDAFQFDLPLYKRLPVEEGAARLKGTDAAFFSAYVWNLRISLQIARRLKETAPETLIVFGGPQVPDRVDAFLRANPFVDLACHGEGERPFVAILEKLQSRDWTGVPSISYLNPLGEIVHNPKSHRLNDLSIAPSPYVEGTFAPLMAANPNEVWIALWETNRGCPFSCTFCDWGSATQAKVYAYDIDRIHREVDWFAGHKIEFVFCCDANFGILPRDVDIARYVADVKKKTDYPRSLSVQNTKNATERAYMTQKILADAGLNKGVDIALQSTDPVTLKSIKRDNISLDTYYELQRRFARNGVDTYTDMILGLPGETYDSFTDGVSQIIQIGQHNRIQFNNLSILPNAEMGDPEYQKKYGMVTVETRTINIHGSLTESKDEVFETQELVVATNSMPLNDWVRTRAFCWMTAFLHFDKTFQIPLVLVHQVSELSFKELIEAFCEGDLGTFPVLRSARDFFIERARDIQTGGPEYTQSQEWLNIWWPADEYLLIKLAVENKLPQFYREAERMLVNVLRERFLSVPLDALHDAVLLNQALLKLPFQTADATLDLKYNVWEFYQSVLKNDPVPLAMQDSRYFINRTSTTWDSWNMWCQEVIWYGNKRGAYLYGNLAVGRERAGHF